MVAAPDIREQERICRWIQQEATRLDGLEEKIHHAITLLREYRTALIHAAVTGKIDVRQEVA